MRAKSAAPNSGPRTSNRPRRPQRTTFQVLGSSSTTTRLLSAQPGKPRRLAMVASMGAVETGPQGWSLDDIKQALREVLSDHVELAKDGWKLGTASDCPDKKPFAVVSTESGETVGCHATEREARRHISDLRGGKVKAGLDLSMLSDRARSLLGVKTPTEQMAALLSSRFGE